LPSSSDQLSIAGGGVALPEIEREVAAGRREDELSGNGYLYPGIGSRT
jgi:hypothetical protein